MGMENSYDHSRSNIVRVGTNFWQKIGIFPTEVIANLKKT